MYKHFFKRVFDFLIAMTALLLLGWIILIVALCLLFTNKKDGVFFLQERPGKNGRIFKIIKFRTMTNERGEDGELLPSSQRLTPVGKIVRSLSLDELPQLLNVLKGDMSLIGPRPLLVRYLDLYSPEQARRHEVRPGITGWAQCHGRNSISWAEKFRLDVWYVDHCSLWVDIKVILLTIKKVIKREGINDNSSSNVVNEAFNGTN